MMCGLISSMLHPFPNFVPALNCGAKSCPPIKFFNGESVREELRIAGMAFAEMDDNVRVDVDAKTLWLSQIFSW